MSTVAMRWLAAALILSAFAANPRAPAQDAPPPAPHGNPPQLIVGHPFSAIKFARRIRVLPNGKQQFLRNLRYPTQIARDSDGRLMMQVIHTDDLAPECDRLDLLQPPPCPGWGVFVIDPVAHKVTHWADGELASRTAVDFPLTPARLHAAAESTSTLPDLPPAFTAQDGAPTTADMGDRDIEGIQAHGVRWTLHYDANQDNRVVHRTRIHEVWTSASMQLVVRVIDGDPAGEETVRGLEKISQAPSPTLFRPPDGFRMQHQLNDQYTDDDFENLKSWFEE
jgi:hypothetical protein